MLFITDYCTVHLVPPQHRPLTKDLIEYSSMANLCVFHVGTCVNTNYTKIHTDLFFYMHTPYRFTSTATQKYTNLCARTPYRDLFCGYMLIYSDVESWVLLLPILMTKL